MELTKQETTIIELIREEAERLCFGSLIVNLKVYKGKVTNIQTKQIEKSVNLEYNDKGGD